MPCSIKNDIEIDDSDFENLDRDRETMRRRFHENVKVKVGDMMPCAACGTNVVKTTYHQKFCRSTRNGIKRPYPCKDRFQDIVQPARAAAYLAAS